MDGGNLGTGSGTTYVAQVTPGIFPACRGNRKKLVEYASNAQKAIENAAKREVKNAMARFRAFLDKVMQTNGNGAVGLVGSFPQRLQHGQAPGAQLVYYDQTISGIRPNTSTTADSATLQRSIRSGRQITDTPPEHRQMI